MDDEELSELTEQFVRVVGEMMSGMRAAFRRELEAYAITPPQLFLMKVVARSGGSTVTELSNELMIAPPTASRMIEGLCSRGLLSKRKASGDQRVTVVGLTEESRRFMEDLRDLQLRVMASVFDGEDAADIRKNVEAMGRLAGKLRAARAPEARKGLENG